MQIPRALLGGLIGGVIGALVWTAVVVFTGYEVGYVAWGIGGLVGFGVQRFCGKQNLTRNHGFAAAAVALLSIVTAKYLVADVSVGLFERGIGAMEFESDEMIAFLAEDLIENVEANGKSVERPEVADDADVEVSAYYPPHIWKTASAMWNEASEEEKEMMISKEKEMIAASAGLESLMVAGQTGDVTEEVMESFSLFDLLWMGLATVTAYQMAGGGKRKVAEDAEKLQAEPETITA